MALFILFEIAVGTLHFCAKIYFIHKMLNNIFFAESNYRNYNES